MALSEQVRAYSELQSEVLCVMTRKEEKREIVETAETPFRGEREH